MIPKHGQRPKFTNKTVTIDLEVWNQLANRNVNMSELVRLKLEEALRELLNDEASTVSKAQSFKVARR